MWVIIPQVLTGRPSWQLVSLCQWVMPAANSLRKIFINNLLCFIYRCFKRNNAFGERNLWNLYVYINFTSGKQQRGGKKITFIVIIYSVKKFTVSVGKSHRNLHFQFLRSKKHLLLRNIHLLPGNKSLLRDIVLVLRKNN